MSRGLNIKFVKIGDHVYLVGLLVTPVLVKNIPLKSTTRYENYEKSTFHSTPRSQSSLTLEIFELKILKDLQILLIDFLEYFLNVIIVFCTCKFRID